MKKLFIFLALLLTIITPGASLSEEINGPELLFNDNNINISLTLSLNKSQLDPIKDGIPQEIIFYVDLFRRWSIWPDEYLKGRKIIRSIKPDPVKGEFIVTSFDGSTLLEKRFTSFDSMLKWALSIKDVTFLYNNLSEEGSYFIRITVESHKRTLPKIIGYVFFFINDRDFKITKDSETFRLSNQ